MKGRTIVAQLAVFLAVFLLAGSSQAGGLYISSFGTPAMGTATAGANAIAEDASTAFHNPAGMTRLDDHQVLTGLAPGFGVTEFDADADTPSGGSDGGNQGGFVPITSSQYVHKLSERWRLGLSLLSISGASLDPDNDWAGRNQTTKVTLFSLTLMPSVAVRLTDWLSVGGGVGISYGKLDINVRASLPDGLPGEREPMIKLKDMDDWEVAPYVGVLFEPTPELRLGVLYQGETDFDLTGKVEIPIAAVDDVAVDLDFPLAQAVRASVFWEASGRFDLLASGGWEDWSTAKSLPVAVGRGSASVPLKFRDTWYVAGGVHYHLNDAWTLQTGLRYDSSALKDRDRTAALPVDRVWTLGVGGLYDWSENLRIGLSFVWSDLGKAPINTEGVVKGKYSPNDLFLFGVSLDWKKLPWSGRATL
jgi:long-chain fatty acid transport protein